MCDPINVTDSNQNFARGRNIKLRTILFCIIAIPFGYLYGIEPDSQGIQWYIKSSGYKHDGVWHAYYKIVDVSNTTERTKRVKIPQIFPTGGDYDVLDGISVQYNAFLNCKGIAELFVPSAVDDIKAGSLNCKESLLTNILVDAENEYYSSQNGLLLSKDGKKVIQGVNGDVRVPEQVTEIGCRAFAYCTNLTSISFGETVPIIDSQAFYNINKSCICRVPFKGDWRYMEDIPGVWNGINTDYTVCVVRLFLNNGTIDHRDDIIPMRTSSSVVMLTNGGLVGSLPVAQRIGYTFIGWFDGYGNNVILDAMLASSIKVYAQWVANRYIVSFNADGGVVAESEIDHCVVYDSPYGLLPTPTRTGYSFSGWLLGGSKVTSQTVVKMTADHTLVASWTPNQYMVSYDANGGSVSGVTGKSVTFDSAYGSLPTPIRKGYTFAGWTLDGKPISADVVVRTANDHTLVAQWTINHYNVMFDANGGTGGYEAIQDYGTEVVPPNVMRDGCTFEGWMPGVSATVPASNVTYKAKWKVWSVKVDSTAQAMRTLYPNDFANITNVTFVVGVTNIPQEFFDGCRSLRIVSIPDSVMDIDDYVFAGCTNLQTEVWGGYRVLDGWLIGYTDEAEETIPDADKLKGICSEALKGCTALKRLEFGDDSRLVSVGAEALKGCTELKTLVLPPSLTRIGDEAFMGCSYLDNVIVPGGVKSIGNRAFKNCTGFTWAQIEHGVESIGKEAFYGCWRITEVDIPSSVSSIGVNAFGGDSSITKVALRGDIRKVSEMFSTYGQITEATVKPGAGALVDGLFCDCSRLKKVFFLGNCPALQNGGRDLYAGTPYDYYWYAYNYDYDDWEPFWLITYVDKDSTGWDGTPGSHTLPMMWPLEGDNRREIRYTDTISTPCSVTFDANGGTPKTQNVKQRSEELFVLPAAPNRADHLFMGWWTEKNGGVKVTDETVFLTGVYETLYAHWTKKRTAQSRICEDAFSGIGTVELDDNDNIVVMLSSDVNGTVEIPDNVGRVMIDLNGHSIVGADGRPAILVVPGNGVGETSQFTIVDTSGGEKGQVVGNGESVAIDIADDAAPSVTLDVDDDVAVLNGDGTEQQWREFFPVELVLQAGEYFKATLAELGYDVPTDGTAYNVVAKGLPAGLQLKSNAAVKDKKGRVVKAAKSEWWIEGVPTAKLDFFENPPYLVITVNGVSVTAPLPIQVAVQEVTELPDLVLGQSLNEQYYLQGVGAGWTVSGLPTGLKYATKKVTKTTGSGKKKVTTTVAEAYAVYGKTTKAGLFTITAKKKVGAFYEAKKFRVLVKPAAVDVSLFGNDLTNITTMAYVPINWDLTGSVPSVPPVPFVPSSIGGSLAKVTGLPTGLSFAASDTYAYTNAKKKTGKYLKQKGQTIVGTPTKAGTYVVTFTKNVKEKVKGKMKTVAKTAQILWVVTQNDAELSLGFNTVGGVIESGVVGLKYTDLMAFSATSDATVTASGLPAGITLANLGGGQYAFTGFTAKAGTYLVTVKAALNGKAVTQRVALKVDGLPSWAKGTFNGYVAGADYATNGLATITVSAAGKVSGKFYDRGTNWTFTAASYTGYDDAAPAYTVPIEAKFAYKVTEKVKGKKKTVTKYVTRSFTLTVAESGTRDACPYRGVATLEEVGVGSTVHARQNLWGSTYKALGKTLFSSKSGKKTLAYKTFAIKSTDPAGVAMGLLPTETLSLKVTTAGAVTATMSFDTGKRPKGKAVIYKATCSTVVIPLTEPDAPAAEFKGEAHLYFAPSTKNSFTGFAGGAPF